MVKFDKFMVNNINEVKKFLINLYPNFYYPHFFMPYLINYCKLMYSWKQTIYLIYTKWKDFKI